jgi:hypothetical protein
MLWILYLGLLNSFVCVCDMSTVDPFGKNTIEQSTLRCCREEKSMVGSAGKMVRLKVWFEFRNLKCFSGDFVNFWKIVQSEKNPLSVVLVTYDLRFTMQHGSMTFDA